MRDLNHAAALAVALVSITGETLEAEYARVDSLRLGGLAIRGLPIASPTPISSDACG